MLVPYRNRRLVPDSMNPLSRVGLEDFFDNSFFFWNKRNFHICESQA